jgi:PAS domain S-box-containing protein
MSTLEENLRRTVKGDDSGRLQTLYEVNDLLKQAEADGLDMNVILPRVLQVAMQQLNAQSGSIIVVNANIQPEYVWMIDEKEQHHDTTPYLDAILEDGLAGWVIRNQEPAIIPDSAGDDRWLSISPDSRQGREPCSVISTPLISRTRRIGAITMTKPGYNKFDTNDLNLLTAIASQAASTIENARLYEESRRQAVENARLYREAQHQLRVSTLLNEAGKVINSSLDLNEIMQSLLAQMNELLNVDALSIALVDKQRQELVYEVAEGIGSDKIVGLRMPSNEGVSGWVMEHGTPALVPDAGADERFSDHGDERTGFNTKALICAPLQVKGEVLGTVQAINPIEGPFTENDLRLLVNLANLAGSAIDNAQQFARTQAAEERYMGLFEDSIDPIILTDSSGNIVEVNKPACVFLEYNREELLKLELKDLHPDVVDVLNLAFSDGQEAAKISVFSSHIVTKNHKKIPVEVHGKRITTGENHLLQWIHHDISKQVELDEMREDLMAMIFHDLQNPLGNILASLELLNYELPPDSDPVVLSIVEIASRSSKRLQTLVHSLLDINRLEAGHPISNQEMVDIHQLIRDAEEMVRPNLERRDITLITNFAPVLPQLYIDEDMIRRVMINLLDNAYKFSPEGKTITLEVVYKPEVSEVLVSISDEGMGIPEQYRETVFNKFRRVQAKGGPKGLGLGLAFCRLAVEAHGGRIWVDSAQSGGARFNFILPTPDEN